MSTPDSMAGGAGSLQLSVVIPVYNEKFTLRELVRRVAAVDIHKEIIVVDDGSTDGTTAILHDLAPRTNGLRAIYQHTNRGKGAAIRLGIEAARGEFVIIQDADLEYDPADYHRLLQPLLSGQADVVYGSRFMAGPRRVHLFWHAFANKTLTLLTNVTTNLNLTDMETCYKVFRTDLIKAIPLRSNRFGFEPEVTAKLAKLGCRLFEVPVSYSGRDYIEGKKIGVTDALAAIWTILKFWVVDDVGDVGHYTLARMAELATYNYELYQVFERHIGQRVLEIGAGLGNLSRFVLDKEFVLLTDYEPVYLNVLRRKFGAYANVEILALNLEHFCATDLRQASIESVLCLNVLEHIQDDGRLLRELHAALQPGGNLILVVPAHPALYSPIDTYLGHYRRYQKGDLIDKLQSAGFGVDTCTYFNWIGALGWLVFARMLRRRYISKAATRGFRVVSALRSVEKYVSFPFGLSLVVIATRRQ